MKTHRLLRHKLYSLPIFGFLACIGSLPAIAHGGMGQEIVDQENIAPSFIVVAATFRGTASGPRGGLAQTFTVGRSGILSRIDLQIGQVDRAATKDLEIDIRPTDEHGFPLSDDASVLFSTFIPPSTLGPFRSGDFVSIDLSMADILVSLGDVLAVTARTEDVQGYGWLSTLVFAFPEVYYGGRIFDRIREGEWSEAGYPEDFLGFRTYVTVPEPTPSAMIASLVAIGMMGNRHRQPMPC